jgi:flagellar basal-body rod modification protein FlgD
MTSTNPVSQTTTPATTPAQSKTTPQTLGKDDFLKLLVGQLQHQDPMAPSDDQQWIGQMAAFSQLEQVSNMAETTKQIVDTLNMNGTLSLIGHTVTYLDDTGASHSGKVETVDVTDGKASLTVDGVAGIDSGSVTQVK